MINPFASPEIVPGPDLTDSGELKHTKLQKLLARRCVPTEVVSP